MYTHLRTDLLFYPFLVYEFCKIHFIQEKLNKLTHKVNSCFNIVKDNLDNIQTVGQIFNTTLIPKFCYTLCADVFQNAKDCNTILAAACKYRVETWKWESFYWFLFWSKIIALLFNQAAAEHHSPGWCCLLRPHRFRWPPRRRPDLDAAHGGGAAAHPELLFARGL